ncbi:M20 family metallopeptidase [Coralloluteibacterium thermophilus]|uniref:M20 family metallopeptidase n=1 Tax=Coralloluteibacterium thermophilum TaxID=2707049 RepID=A0ABV9NKB1_9GAMM
MSRSADTARFNQFVAAKWDEELIPVLSEYIAIPCKSPMFDADWAKNGHLDAAIDLAARWVDRQGIEGLRMEVVRLEGRTPLLFIEIPGTDGADGDDCVLLYGHLDKQPEVTGWDDGKGPWTPVLENDRLYGRGSADDGYALFGSITALLAVREQKLPHARCVLMIETCEESGSYDLPYYIDHLAPRIGTPSLVVCLDSGCGNYEQLWLTTSLRGMTGGNLRVEVLEDGVHSGDASGIVPSSFRILRQLLSRLEDEATGRVLPDVLHAEIPPARIEQARLAAEVLGDEIHAKFPLVEGLRPMGEDNAERILNRTWRPALSITGADGLPPLGGAGNVLRPSTAVKLSLRLPPTVDGATAGKAVSALLTQDPPYGARVTLDLEKASSGWNAPEAPAWLSQALEDASQAAFGKPPVYIGEGGSIPLMALLGEKFPAAQFVITGVLGPHSNAHGPNEFLHIPMVKRVTACMALVLARHYENRPGTAARAA